MDPDSYKSELVETNKAKRNSRRVFSPFLRRWPNSNGWSNRGKQKVVSRDTKCFLKFFRSESKSPEVQISVLPESRPNFDWEDNSRIGHKANREFGEVPGIHLGNRGEVNKDIQQIILEKSRTKLTGWKAKLLTAAGRHTLIRSTLEGILGILHASFFVTSKAFVTSWSNHKGFLLGFKWE